MGKMVNNRITNFYSTYASYPQANEGEENPSSQLARGLIDEGDTLQSICRCAKLVYDVCLDAEGKDGHPLGNFLITQWIMLKLVAFNSK